MARRFGPGETAVLREVWRGRIWTARPVVVVEDAPERQAFYVPPGMVFKCPLNPDGTWQRVPSDDWDLGNRVWRDKRILSFAWPGVAHAALLFWDDATDEFLGWYVNLQEPLRRTPTGFDYMDHMLDLWIEPDRTWSWKDEEELEECVRRGLFSTERAAEIRTEGERALAQALAAEPPFEDRWIGWRPDPSWPIPELPSGWDA